MYREQSSLELKEMQEQLRRPRIKTFANDSVPGEMLESQCKVEVMNFNVVRG